MIVSGLLRAAEAVGGNGVVVKRGDSDAGALLVVLTTRGEQASMWERSSSIEGDFTWNQTKKRGESSTSDSVAQLIDEKKRFDRDIWVVELDIPNVQQFIVDSLGQT